jgi:hypothetical protein
MAGVVSRGALSAILLAISPGPPAIAAWGTTGSGDGTSRAIVLATATHVTATCAPPSEASITWDVVPHATSYLVERSTDLMSWTSVTTVSGPPATDTGLALLPGLHPRWRITAGRENWLASPSAPSNAVSVSVLGICV